MGSFEIELLFSDNTWSTRYKKIPKDDSYSDPSTQWTMVSLNFNSENNENNSIYDQIETPHSDMCFSNITIPHSVL